MKGKGSFEEGHAAVIFGAPLFRRHSYGKNHPLGIPRVALTLDLIRSFGAIEDGEYIESRQATVEELGRFHKRDYIEAVRECEKTRRISASYREKYNFGNFENPWFEGFFTTPATAAGASIQGAEQVIGGRVAFNPAGGMHHAMPGRARGFCFFNDGVLGVMRLRSEGMKVLYIDLDAHLPDGVVHAFRDDPGTVVASIHMDTSYAYPFEGGRIRDRGAHDNLVNLPLPKGINDSEYRAAFKQVFPRLFRRFRPDAVVLQSGTDIIFSDPLGKFEVSTQLFLEAVRTVTGLCPENENGIPRLLVIGGGGYHPLALARCWAGMWGLISGRNLPVKLPEKGSEILAGVEWDDDEEEDYYGNFFISRLDEPREGEVREDVLERIDALIRTHPLLGN